MRLGNEINGTEKRITVFTPSYNRANLLPRLYESLLRQTCQNYEWLIIDDGSTDNTKDLVNGWIAEGKVQIRYVYKENGGLATGYNKAIELMDTELSICIDSDDYLTGDCIESVLTYWDENKNDNVAGLIGLDIYENGEIIGGRLPEEKQINAIMLIAEKHKCDSKYVVRNDCYRRVAPMPIFAGERNLNPHYLVLKLCREYEFLIMNKPLCVVDYQENGMSRNIFRQYLESPRSFAEYRRVIMKIPAAPFKYLLTTVIHYVSSSILAKDRHYIRNSPKKLLTVLCTPAGWLLTAYIRKKAAQLKHGWDQEK